MPVDSGLDIRGSGIMKLNNESVTAGSRRNRAFAKTGKIRCMKKRLISALLSTTLFAAAALAGVPLTNKIAYAATEKTKDNTTLGAGVLKDGVNTSAAKTVYYGNGREWRVIGYDGTGVAAASGCLTLFASNNLATTQFNPSTGNNHYKDSALQGTLTGIYNSFAEKEKSNDVLTARTLEGGSGNYGDRTYDSNKIAGSAVSDAPLWPLSYGEADSLNAGLSPANGDWWLRSPGEYGYQAAHVFGNGVVSMRGTNLAYNEGARPAFYLKLSSIIFTSQISGKYKLTIKDSNLKASAKSDKNLSSASAGDTVKISYSSVAGSPDRLSVLMTDKAWDESGARVKYYGKLDISGTIGTSGTVDFTLPADFDSSWKVYIVPEQTNDDDTKTDYAGNPSLITLLSPTITTESLPDGKVGTAYNQTLKAADTSGDVKWEKESGNLPDGLSLSEDGEISGTPEKTGTYTFTVKVTANNGSDTKELSIKVSDKKPDKCTITFDANGGKGEMDAQEVEKNKATKLNKNEYTRDGYTFKEWNTKTDGSGESYKDEASITPKGDMTLYAQWTKGDDGKEKARSEGDVKVKLTEETLKILNDSLDPDLKKKVDEALAEGKEVDFVFSSKYLGSDAEGAKDISGYSKDKGYTIGEFFDLSLDVRIDGETVGSISNTSGKIRLDVTIKESLRKEGRLFHILRFHENDVSEVGSGRGSVVPIKTDGFSTYAITYEDGADKDDDDDDHEEHKPASWELNPNEKQQLSIVWKGTGTGVSAGYQEQGDIAKGVIKKAVPVGYKEAFSFDLLVNGKTDTSLKSGTMTLTIPAEYLKATVSAGQIGRQYAIIALDRYGKTYLLTDTDANPNTVTVNVNFEGFAMELIYTG